MADIKDWKYTTKMVAVELLLVDHNYQRDLTAKVRNIVENFRPWAIGIIAVSKRANGDLFVVDGQHRVEASKRLGHLKLEAHVYENLTPAMEADLFVWLNSKANMRAWYDFNSRVKASHPDHVAMEKMLASIGHSACSGRFQAVRVAEWIYRGAGGRSDDGPSLLKSALGVYVASWRPLLELAETKAAIDGSVLHALAAVLAVHVDLVDPKDMSGKLAKTTPAALIGQARALSVAGPVWSRISFFIVARYNAGRRGGPSGGKLPVWEISSRDEGEAREPKQKAAKKSGQAVGDIPRANTLF
jgi:hypothetical protein